MDIITCDYAIHPNRVRRDPALRIQEVYQDSYRTRAAIWAQGRGLEDTPVGSWHKIVVPIRVLRNFRVSTELIPGEMTTPGYRVSHEFARWLEAAADMARDAHTDHKYIVDVQMRRSKLEHAISRLQSEHDRLLRQEQEHQREYELEVLDWHTYKELLTTSRNLTTVENLQLADLMEAVNGKVHNT